MLIVLAGLPGVGKSTLASTLSKRIGAYVLDKDYIRDSIFPSETIDYGKEQNALATNVMFDVAEYVLRRDPNAFMILDGKPFSKAEQLQEVVGLAQNVRHNLKIIHCVARDDVVRRRLEEDVKRDPRNIVARRNIDKYYAIKQTFDPIELVHYELDASGEIDAVADEAMEFLLT